jgi:hypothetical protein
MMEEVGPIQRGARGSMKEIPEKKRYLDALRKAGLK